MKQEMLKEIRFYVCLTLAFILLMISLFLPPVNVITQSVLWAAIIVLGTGALSIGLDISGIIREVRLLRETMLKIDDKSNNE